MLQMLREKLLQLLELVQARGVGGGAFSSSLHSVPACTASHSGTPVSFETHKGAVTPHLLYPQPSTIPAEGSPCTSLPGHFTAPHPCSQASPGACIGSRSKKRGVTETVPLCRSWHSPRLQSRRTHTQEVIEEETGCYMCTSCHAKSELIALV